MGFIVKAFVTLIEISIAIVVAVVEIVVQIVEVIIQLIMVILGFIGPTEQTIEYFEVRNHPLFRDFDNNENNPLLSVILGSIMRGSDMVTDVLYANTFRSQKVDLREFVAFIEDGNYFENFPIVDSYILLVNYDEVDAVLTTLNGVPVTVERAKANALSNSEWIQSYLQENYIYNVGDNEFGEGEISVDTNPGSPAADTSNESSVSNGPGLDYTLDLTSDLDPRDLVTGSQVWNVDFGSVVFNSGPDNYNVNITQGATTKDIGFTIPSKPLNLHYIVYYYQDSAPARQYIFIYKVGLGTYPTLDDIESPINEDNSVLQAMPHIPLRISNSNFSTFGATKAQQITDLVEIINMDAQSVLDAVLDDVDLQPGDVDNIYMAFGVNMKDPTQSGMGYLFNLCENLYATQAVTKGIYDATPSVDDKPQNNIVITSDDNKNTFQFSYITFEFTTLAAINAAPGSDEYAVYYSDASKFNDSNILVYPYFSSSAKSTYNVGFKSDNLTEVANFLTGSGTANTGTITAEASSWMQVTTRLSYNNPSPVLQDPDGTTSALIFLTPDAVYENVSGTLRHVEQASEETTAGQSVTYYECVESGLNAYTMVAPISILNVVDGDTGVFKVVKLNLGGENDLLAPFIYDFVKDFSNKLVTQLFLNGSYVSIYIAHYEVIEIAGMGFFEALVLLVIIIVVIVLIILFPPAGGAVGTLLGAVFTAGVTVTAAMVQAAIIQIIITMAVQYIIQTIITEIAKTSPELAMILGVVAAVGMAMWQPNVTPGAQGGFVFDLNTFSSFESLTPFDFAMFAVAAMQNIQIVQNVQLDNKFEDLNTVGTQQLIESAASLALAKQSLSTIEKLYEDIFGGSGGTFDFGIGIDQGLRSFNNADGLPAETLYASQEGWIGNASSIPDNSEYIDMQVSSTPGFA